MPGVKFSISGLHVIGEGTLPWAIFRFRIFQTTAPRNLKKLKKRFERVITQLCMEIFV